MAGTTETDQPLSPSGRLFLQPLMNQVIICALGGDHPIPVAPLKTQIQNSVMLKHPRFCSLMVRDSGGREHWRRTHVDIDRHIIIHTCPLHDDPSVSDEDAVNGYVADLSYSSPLSADKPLWEIHVLAAHKAAVFRVHHALGDGISLMALLLSGCRRVDDPAEAPSLGVSGAAVSGFRRWSVWTAVRMVLFTLVYVWGVLVRVFWVRDKATAVSGGDGVEGWPRGLATARFRLDDFKTVKRAVAGSTINDVLFGVISSGLSRYLDIRSPKALQEGDQITGLAMVNLRPHQGLEDFSKLMNSNSLSPWGNKFGVILLPVYYHRHHSNPLQYVKTAKSMIDKKKLSLEALFTYKLMDFVTYLFGPKFTSILNHRLICNSTFTISNIVGPGEDIMLVGNLVKYIRVTSSSLPHAITMHMLSYAGNADMQILVAKDIIPDPKILAKCFEDALFEMKKAALDVLNY